jgi:hypothetical protein
MNIYKKTAKIKPLKLNKDVLLQLEFEITKIWLELRDKIEEDLLKKFTDHNEKVKKHGYSFIISTDEKISKKTFTQVEAKRLIHSDPGLIKNELRYPLSRPVIKYHDNDISLIVDTVNDLYKHSIKDKFSFFEIEAVGLNSKKITLNLSSNSGFSAIDQNNSITVTSDDQSWTRGTIDVINSVVVNYEKPYQFFYTPVFLFITRLVLPLTIVYGAFKILSYFFSITSSVPFIFWVQLFIYSLIFGFSLIKLDQMYERYFPASTLDDRKSVSRQNSDFFIIAIILSVIGTAIYDLLRFILSVKWI